MEIAEIKGYLEWFIDFIGKNEDKKDCCEQWEHDIDYLNKLIRGGKN